MPSTAEIRRCILIVFILLLALWTPPASSQDGIKIHGLVSQGYIRSSDNNFLARTSKGSFEFNEAIINFSTQVDEKLRLGIQLLSRNLGGEGKGAVTLDWGFGDYRWKEELGVRVGKVKLSNGIYNKGRDIDILRTAVFLPQSNYREDARDFAHSYHGFSLYGSKWLDRVGRLHYEMLVGTLTVADPNAPYWENIFFSLTGDLINFLSPGARVDIDDIQVTVDYATGGALTWDLPIEGARLAGSWLQGKVFANVDLNLIVPVDLGAAAPEGSPALQNIQPQSLDLNTDLDGTWTLSAEYNRDNLLLATEWSRQKVTAHLFGIPLPLESEGYYALASYRLNERLELGTYYSKFYPDVDDKKGRALAARGQPAYQAWQEDIAFSIRLDATDNMLLKTEIHLMDGAGLVNPVINSGKLERDWILYMGKVIHYF